MTQDPTRPTGWAKRLSHALGLLLVVIGMLNTLPSIPGLDDGAARLLGDGVKIRRFSFEYLAPLCFFIMMCAVALDQSMARLWRGTRRHPLGLMMDVALVVMAAAIALAYLIEIDSVCLIDQFTGERAELIARALRGNDLPAVAAEVAEWRPSFNRLHYIHDAD